jgi:hypothetical protein
MSSENGRDTKRERKRDTCEKKEGRKEATYVQNASPAAAGVADLRARPSLLGECSLAGC